MPNHHSAEERVRRNDRDNEKNKNYKRRIRQTLKDIMKCTNKTEALEKLKSAYALADKLVVKGILHRNKSAHVKSQMALKVKAMQ